MYLICGQPIFLLGSGLPSNVPITATCRVHGWFNTRNWQDTVMGWSLNNENSCASDDEPVNSVEIGGVQVDRNKYPSLQRNAAQVKGNLENLT
jgi:hypothetical protein